MKPEEVTKSSIVKWYSTIFGSLRLKYEIAKVLRACDALCIGKYEAQPRQEASLTIDRDFRGLTFAQCKLAKPPCRDAPHTMNSTKNPYLDLENIEVLLQKAHQGVA